MPGSSVASPDPSLPEISDYKELLRLGICKVPIPLEIARERLRWAEEVTTVPLVNMGFEGDGDYAFYRNIMEDSELEFPFDAVLKSGIGESIRKHFNVTDMKEIRLDDAFCVHYNMSQNDSSGAKHMDPSDITVNLCIEKTNDVRGSQVLFYGTRKLDNCDGDESQETTDTKNYKFLVPQEEGYGTIHFGDHPHETLPLLEGGKRTNIILTYCHVDESKSDVRTRTCYFDI